MSTIPIRHSDGSPNRTELIGIYVLSAIIPIAGVGFSAYLAVAKRTATVRRHAIGVIAVALITATLYVVYALQHNGSGISQDEAVREDLNSLILTRFQQIPNNVQCVHQTDSQFVCQVTWANNTQQTAMVTDDGHNIYETGLTNP